MIKKGFSGLILKDVNCESMQEWLEEYHKNYGFKFIFKNGKKSRLKEIKTYKKNGQYFLLGEHIQSPLLTLTSNIMISGVSVDSFYLDRVDSIEVYYK